MRLVMLADVVALVAAWILAFGRYPAVPTKPDLYVGFLVLTCVLAIASSIGVRGAAMHRGEVRIPVWTLIKEAPRWTLAVAVLGIGVFAVTQFLDGNVEGTLDAASLRTTPALGRTWLTLCGLFLGASVAMAGAGIRAKDASMEIE